MDGQPVVNLFYGGRRNVCQRHCQGGVRGGWREPGSACGGTDFHGKVICFRPLYEGRQQDSALSFYKSEAGVTQRDRLLQAQCHQTVIQLFHGCEGGRFPQHYQGQRQHRGRKPKLGWKEAL